MSIDGNLKVVIRTVLVLLLVFISSLLMGIQGHDYLVNLDVGQGDSALIQIGEYKVLIDGGPGDNVIHEIGKYMGNDKDIDLVILTHLHLDHLSGLLSILDYYHIHKFVMNNVCSDDPLYKLLLKKLSDQKIPIIYTDYVKLTADTDAIENISYTKISKDCVNFSNLNNSSVITLLTFNSSKYLFMGDAELEEEASFISKHKEDILNVNYIKLGHHCSRTATSLEFLKLTKPKIVVCSYGFDNIYGHPHKETLEKLKNLNIPMYSTVDSDVVINLQ